MRSFAYLTVFALTAMLFFVGCGEDVSDDPGDNDAQCGGHAGCAENAEAYASGDENNPSARDEETDAVSTEKPPVQKEGPKGALGAKGDELWIEENDELTAEPEDGENGVTQEQRPAKEKYVAKSAKGDEMSAAMDGDEWSNEPVGEDDGVTQEEPPAKEKYAPKGAKGDEVSAAVDGDEWSNEPADEDNGVTQEEPPAKEKGAAKGVLTAMGEDEFSAEPDPDEDNVTQEEPAFPTKK